MNAEAARSSWPDHGAGRSVAAVAPFQETAERFGPHSSCSHLGNESYRCERFAVDNLARRSHYSDQTTTSAAPVGECAAQRFAQ